VKLDLDKITPVKAGIGSIEKLLSSPSTISRIKEVVDGVRLMIKEAKELQPSVSTPSAIPVNTALTSPASGLTITQLMTFGKQFLDNMIAQGYGDLTVSEAIDKVPFTLKQIRGLLK